jgi:hypothetical protein
MRAALDHLLQRCAFQMLHGDEGSAVLLAEIVDGADVGMIESGSGFCFALKTRESLGILGDGRGKELQRDVAAETRVFCLIGDTHASGAKSADNAITRIDLA